jgi:uncharacterized protein YfbU (UPF0304 family)
MVERFMRFMRFMRLDNQINKNYNHMDTIKCNMPTLNKQKQYLTFWWSQYGCIHWMNRFLYAWRATNRNTGELVEGRLLALL